MTQSLVLQGRQELTAGTPSGIVTAVYLDAAIDSPNTRRSYARHLEEGLSFLGCAALADITGADLAALRAHVLANGLSPLSQGLALSAMRSLLAWSGSMGAHRLPAEVVRVALRIPSCHVQRPYSALNEQEIRDILAVASTPRDKAILAVLLGGGLRVAESVALDVEDIIEDADGGTMLAIRQGKGRRDRQVPVGVEVAATIHAYLVATGRTLGDTGPLFRAHDRGASRRQRNRLSSRAVGSLVKRCAAAARIDVKCVSPHTLRHSYALRCLRHGGNVVAVAKLLGHRNISSTQRYVDHLALNDLRAAIPPLPI